MGELVSVEVVNGKPSVTSLQVAAAFGKEHFNVLNDIRKTADKCYTKFTGLNFQVSEYTDSTGRKLPMYILSKDGLLIASFIFTNLAIFAHPKNLISQFTIEERAYFILAGNTVISCLFVGVKILPHLGKFPPL